MRKKERKIHKNIIKHLLIFRYPKIEFLILSILIAYAVFTQTTFPDKIGRLDGLGYIGIFIAGMLYSFGFSASFAVGFFLTVKDLNIFLAAIIGGLGSLLTDLIIFTVIRFSFMDEFNRIKKTKPFLFVEKLMEKDLNSKTRRVLLYITSCIMIASPLPDEVAVTILSGLTNLKLKGMAVISIILSTIGILIWLLVGRFGMGS